LTNTIPLPLFVPAPPSQGRSIPADAAWTVRLSPKYDALVETWIYDGVGVDWNVTIRKDGCCVECHSPRSAGVVHEILRGWLP
jgi:hypothetical protein